MKMTYRTKRLLALLILLLGLPLYAVLVISGMAFLVNLPTFVELFLYVFFGVVWVIPLKVIFRGIGQSNPDNNF